jgi:hypothetical protein
VAANPIQQSDYLTNDGQTLLRSPTREVNDEQITAVAIEEVARWSKDTSSKSNERLEIGRFPHQKKQSFLSRFDYGGATSLSGTS